MSKHTQVIRGSDGYGWQGLKLAFPDSPSLPERKIMGQTEGHFAEDRQEGCGMSDLASRGRCGMNAFEANEYRQTPTGC